MEFTIERGSGARAEWHRMPEWNDLCHSRFHFAFLIEKSQDHLISQTVRSWPINISEYSLHCVYWREWHWGSSLHVITHLSFGRSEQRRWNKMIQCISVDPLWQWTVRHEDVDPRKGGNAERRIVKGVNYSFSFFCFEYPVKSNTLSTSMLTYDYAR
jgi:hypothetical protein